MGWTAEIVEREGQTDRQRQSETETDRQRQTTGREREGGWEIGTERDWKRGRERVTERERERCCIAKERGIKERHSHDGMSV